MTRVAVIGAGASCLCVLRHLTERPEAFGVVCFEQANCVGGLWVYDECVRRDNKPVHSSMYACLRTNIPKEVMMFPDFAFRKDLPSYITHRDVRNYLEDYCSHFQLRKYIKFETEVIRVHPQKWKKGNDTWSVSFQSTKDTDVSETTEFDAVIVCNGHLAVPRIPAVQGLETFTGRWLHSHEFRELSPYKDEIVLCVGFALSGQDLAVNLSTVATLVYVSHTDKPFYNMQPENVIQKPDIKQIIGSDVMFVDGTSVTPHVIILCTGYLYCFPFLTPDCHVDTTDECVMPLYKRTIHTEYPSLMFVGLCKLVDPFPHFDIQVRFIKKMLDGSLKLPSEQKMNDHVKRSLRQVATRRHHYMLGFPEMWEYYDEIAAIINVELIPRNVVALYGDVIERRTVDKVHYRDFKYELTDESFTVKYAL